MGDIVQGPWGSRAPDPTSPDDGDVLDDVQEAVTQLANDLFDSLQEMDIDVDNLEENGYIKDLILISESLRSFILKTHGRYHACQDIADSLYYFDGQRYQTQNSLIVEFK